MVSNCVIDLSHNNGHVNLSQAAQNGILAVILKASEDQEWTDPLLQENALKARNAGLLLGAYHFATGADPHVQAIHFLETIKAYAPILPILDFEQNTLKSSTSMGTTMTLEQARDFVTDVTYVTSRIPVLYGGYYLKQQLAGKEDAVLSVCPLWLASYSPQASLPPGFDRWLMWQYTDGRSGNQPHTVPGIGAVDRSMFNCDAPQVTSWWNDNAWDGVMRVDKNVILAGGAVNSIPEAADLGNIPAE